VVISFHSLEDRIVKQFIAQHSRETVDRNDPNWMLALNKSAQSAMKLVAIERIKPSDVEVAANPRSRSAVMRVAQRSEGLL
jgi:16S rRNA (cytosine1402-N4)-methyltransferase